MKGLPLTFPHFRPFGVENEICHMKVFPVLTVCGAPCLGDTPPPQAISISRQEGRMRSQEMMSEAKVMRQPKEKLKGEMTEIKHKVGKRTASIRLNRHLNPRRSHSDAKIISKRFRTPICYIAFMSIVPLVVQKHSHLLDLLTSLIKGGTFDALFA